MLRSILRRLGLVRPVRTLPSLQAYARWAARYPPYAHNALMEAEEAAMLALLPELAGRVVLDLGSGTGRYGLLALERGAGAVIGLDNSPAMLRASALACLLQASSEAIPLASASVDVVLCGLALGHLPTLVSALQEVARVLTADGQALISDFHPFLYVNGRQRTFLDHDGRVYAVEHYPHFYEDYHRAACGAGLAIDSVVEPRLGQEGEGRSLPGGMSQSVPVVVVYRMRKVAG